MVLGINTSAINRGLVKEDYTQFLNKKKIVVGTQ